MIIPASALSAIPATDLIRWRQNTIWYELDGWGSSSILETARLLSSKDKWFIYSEDDDELWSAHDDKALFKRIEELYSEEYALSIVLEDWNRMQENSGEESFIFVPLHCMYMQDGKMVIAHMNIEPGMENIQEDDLFCYKDENGVFQGTRDVLSLIDWDKLYTYLEKEIKNGGQHGRIDT